ncbi:type I-E CRISPR-associated protein Cas5/CasD [Streptomyces silvisoli]|uniref:Type I-E CRISPR-associated protein Cas5/CasD n=1 Tax=Streptomyces silvisoli TaxID=3034235 RepID=A0ABT5ZRB1_9ACTN|nr:type I-E CRISPR-associated protein Cas5/CasD [Streptomyces silvisoli]MDF3292365.1 type I-E CRISPR-associated protein Cas5/CasD [Streptomyces silvisoli]
MSGMLLRLAGPLQSWGERSVFSPQRDTAPFPTRSGLIGMFAAAEGRNRDQDPGGYADLEFTVRIDRPGELLVDYHTVGGGQPKDRTAATSGGDHKGDAVITRRRYLADAVFVVAVTGPDADIARIADALHQPYWNPYLGRRSCIPDEPFVLRAQVEDPVHELLRTIPLSTPAAHYCEETSEAGTATVPVDFIWETYPLGPLPDDAVSVTITDVPVSYAQHARSHAKRRILRTTEPLAAKLQTSPGDLRQRLIGYATHTEQETA